MCAQNNRNKLVCVVGPTAAGKTKLAVDIALAFGGEVVSADSMQIYRGMDIGTAKPSPEEMRGVPHHMIDVADPNEDYSAARFGDEAGTVIDDVLERGKLPVIAGGTGFYIGAVLNPDGFAPRPENDEIRKELQKLADAKGVDAVFEILKREDPESAEKIDKNNLKRVIRAIEIYRTCGMTRAEFLSSRPSEKRRNTIMIGLNVVPRERLYERINLRVDDMMARGLLNEVRALLENGVRENGTAMQAIGYKELVPAIRGETDIGTAVALIKQRSRNYAKRQLTWFKRDAGTVWFEHTGGNDFEKTIEIIKKYIKDKLQEE